jgi:molybdopterin converting factor small subunit
MDGTAVWPRTSIDGKPALYCTRDAGASWQRQDRGLPREQAWYTVKRQAFCGDDCEPVGLYFGTTCGELWTSGKRAAASARSRSPAARVRGGGGGAALMQVAIPSPLRSYTRSRDRVDAAGRTVAELLASLDRAFPGIRFRIVDEQDRIRVHIRLFVNRVLVRDLAQPIAEGDEVQILCALSGG